MEGILQIDDSQFTSDFLSVFATQINEAIRRAIPTVRSRVRQLSDRAIRESSEFISLLAGKLRGELGVVDAAPVMQSLMERLGQATEVTFEPVRVSGDSLNGKMQVSLSRKDLSDAFSADGISYTSENGYTVDWMKWLLTSGDSIVLADYAFLGKPRDISRSRTGAGIMRHKGGWRVPPEFSGTLDDNFIIRALLPLEEEYVRIMHEEIVK